MTGSRKGVINELLWRIKQDLCSFEAGEHEYLMCKRYEGFGVVLPLDWATRHCPSLEKDWDHFMRGQTFCEYGFYVRDVIRFLYIKRDQETRKEDNA